MGSVKGGNGLRSGEGEWANEMELRNAKDKNSMRIRSHMCPDFCFDPSERTKNIRYAIRDVVVKANKLKQQGHEILHLNIGDPNAYDFDTPEHIKQGTIRALEKGAGGYSPSEGIMPLREAIAAREQNDGRELCADDVVVTAGVTEGLQMLFANLEGKKALIPAPAYPPYTTYAKFYGAIPVEYPTIEEDDWQPDIDFIRRTLELDVKHEINALCIINPNNPTGSFYSEKTVRELMNIAGEFGIMAISDEIYDRMLYDREIVKPGVAKSDRDIPLIIFNGVSKVYFAPGWRIGYITYQDDGSLDMFRESIARQVRARLCPNTPCQYGYLEALRGPHDFLDENIRKLRIRRDYCVKRITEIEGLSTRTPEGAFYMFPKIDDGNVDDQKFVTDLLNACHTLFVHGSGFSTEYGKGHFRMVFLPDLPTLESAFDRIEAFMKGWIKDR